MIVRSLFKFFLLVILFALAGAVAEAKPVRQAARDEKPPAPRDVLGFEPGEDRKLARWSDIVDYFKRLDAASDRVTVQQAGLSTEGRPFIVAIISSEENLRNLPRIRQAQARLADPRLIAEQSERRSLIRDTPAVLAITCSIHSTEIVASQMSMELAYRLASDTSEETAEILRNTVLVLVPSVNPDGIDIVGDWYRKTLGTSHEGTSPPVLYHHYAGHDNNRDWFMLTQTETHIVSRLFWREWFPEIVYDVHQQGQYGSRMVAPPFFDPANPNIDPVILREVGALGMQMAVNLTAAGFKGVATNSTYDMWWHGGLRSAPYYHNSVGILTEAASARIATPIDIKRGQLRSSARGLSNPLEPALNFPSVWEGGTWRMRDILNMELITCRTALEEASLHREELIRNFVDAGARAIEAGKQEAPFAYIVPIWQRDQPTADHMIDILIQQGVEVHVATSDFTYEGKQYGKNSYVILLAQPYRANVKCLFEAQHYPDRRIYPGGPAEQPYDVAGWTLPMQMGVEYVAADKRFDVELRKIDTANKIVGFDSNSLTAPHAVGITAYLLPDANNAYAFINELAKTRDTVTISRLNRPAEISDIDYPAGTFVITPKPAEKANGKRPARSYASDLNELFGVGTIAAKYGVGFDVQTITDKRSGSKPAAVSSDRFKLPRVALYRSWAVSMDEGWTRWVLEKFGFDYKNINDEDIRVGGLRDKFDVVILPDQSMQQIIEGNKQGTYPAQYTGGITEAGVANLKQFVEAGGVLICLDSSSELAIDKFNLPVKNVLDGLKRDRFYAPGSIFQATVDTSNPVAYGMAAKADLYFVSGTRRAQPEPEAAPDSTSATPDASSRGQASARVPSAPIVSAFAFEITDQTRARSVANYVEGNPLRSGWLLGPEYISGKSALVDVSMGRGHVVLFGFRPQHRAQTWGTFKFLFNAILLGGTN